MHLVRFLLSNTDKTVNTVFSGFKLLADGTACSFKWFMKHKKDNNLLEVSHPASKHRTWIPVKQNLDFIASFQGQTLFFPLPSSIPTTLTSLRAGPPEPDRLWCSIWTHQKVFLKQSAKYFLLALASVFVFHGKVTVARLHVYNAKGNWEFMPHSVTSKEREAWN